MFAENINVNVNHYKNPLKDITDNILYYISGYVVKKITPQLTCKFCINATTAHQYRPDHTYCNKINSFKTFTNLKNRGGLQFASESVFKIIKLTEQYFKSLLVDKTLLLKKNIDLHILSAVQNSLALSTSILPDCQKCFENTDVYIRPHKLDLINKICHLYLKIRLHSYSHILTSSIMMESVSKRQKLHKTILFYNM